jgi:hypothetical protein
VDERFPWEQRPNPWEELDRPTHQGLAPPVTPQDYERFGQSSPPSWTAPDYVPPEAPDALKALLRGLPGLGERLGTTARLLNPHTMLPEAGRMLMGDLSRVAQGEYDVPSVLSGTVAKDALAAWPSNLAAGAVGGALQTITDVARNEQGPAPAEAITRGAARGIQEAVENPFQTPMFRATKQAIQQSPVLDLSEEEATAAALGAEIMVHLGTDPFASSFVQSIPRLANLGRVLANYGMNSFQMGRALRQAGATWYDLSMVARGRWDLYDLNFILDARKLRGTRGAPDPGPEALRLLTPPLERTPAQAAAPGPTGPPRARSGVPQPFLHGTTREFQQFGGPGAVDRYGRPQRTPQRYYFTEHPEVAQRFAHQSGTAFRQVDFDRYADMASDFVDDTSTEGIRQVLNQNLNRSVQKGRVLSYVDESGKLIRVRRAEDIPQHIVQDGDVRLYAADRWPQVVKVNIYGRTLDLTNPDNIPADLRKILEKEGVYRPWVERGIPTYSHEFSDALIDYAATHGYGKIRVQDAYESGFESVIGLPEFIEIAQPQLPAPGPARPPVQARPGVAQAGPQTRQIGPAQRSGEPPPGAEDGTPYFLQSDEGMAAFRQDVQQRVDQPLPQVPRFLTPEDAVQGFLRGRLPEVYKLDERRVSNFDAFFSMWELEDVQRITNLLDEDVLKHISGAGGTTRPILDNMALHAHIDEIEKLKPDALQGLNRALLERPGHIRDIMDEIELVHMSWSQIIPALKTFATDREGGMRALTRAYLQDTAAPRYFQEAGYGPEIDYDTMFMLLQEDVFMPEGLAVPGDYPEGIPAGTQLWEGRTGDRLSGMSPADFNELLHDYANSVTPLLEAIPTDGVTYYPRATARRSGAPERPIEEVINEAINNPDPRIADDFDVQDFLDSLRPKDDDQPFILGIGGGADPRAGIVLPRMRATADLLRDAFRPNNFRKLARKLNLFPLTKHLIRGINPSGVAETPVEKAGILYDVMMAFGETATASAMTRLSHMRNPFIIDDLGRINNVGEYGWWRYIQDDPQYGNLPMEQRDWVSKAYEVVTRDPEAWRTTLSGEIPPDQPPAVHVLANAWKRWSRENTLNVEQERTSVAFVDVFERPDRYNLSPYQRKYIDALNEVIADAFRMVEDEGVSIKARVLDDFEFHFPRFTDFYKSMLPSKVGAKQSQQMPRVFETQEGGIQQGTPYARNPMGSVERYLRGSYRMVADQRLLKELERISGQSLRDPEPPDTKALVVRGRQPKEQKAVAPEDAEAQAELRKDIMDLLRKIPEEKYTQSYARIASFNAALRLLQATLDHSAPFTLGLGLLGRRPDLWARATGHSIRVALDPKWYGLYTERNMTSINEMVSYGGQYGIASQELIEGLSAVGSLVSKVPVAGRVLRPAYDRTAFAFASFGDIARHIYWEAMRPVAVNLERKGQLTARRELAESGNFLTGVMSSQALGIGPVQRRVESLLAFAARYTRAQLAFIAAAAEGGLRGHEARMGLAGLLTIGAMATVVGNLAVGKTMEEIIRERLNPMKPTTFMTVGVGGLDIGFGAVFQYLRLMARVYDTALNDPAAFLTGDPRRNPITGWLRGKSSPILSAVSDTFTGDFLGNPTTIPQVAAQSVTPFWADPFIPGPVERQSDPGDMLGTIVGARTIPVPPEREAMRELNNLANHYFRREWDDLNPTQQQQLRAQFPELDTRRTSQFSGRLDLSREQEAGRRVLGRLPDPVRSEMKRIGVDVGGLSRTIGPGFRLNDERYRAYEHYTAEALNQMLPTVLGQDWFSALPDHARRDVIEEVISAGKARARDAVLAMTYQETQPQGAGVTP